MIAFLSFQIIDDHYHFEHRSIAKRSISPSNHHQRRLDEDNRVAWSQQQRAKSRQKRDFTRLKPVRSLSKLLNDPKWSNMWYLNVSIVIWCLRWHLWHFIGNVIEINYIFYWELGVRWVELKFETWILISWESTSL